MFPTAEADAFHARVRRLVKLVDRASLRIDLTPDPADPLRLTVAVLAEADWFGPHPDRMEEAPNGTSRTILDAAMSPQKLALELGIAVGEAEGEACASARATNARVCGPGRLTSGTPRQVCT